MSFVASTSTTRTAPSVAGLTAPLRLRARPRTTHPITVCASQRSEALVPTIAASVAASVVIPDVASATTLTPTVQALLNSVVAGGVIAALILGAVTLVAGFDPIARK